MNRTRRLISPRAGLVLGSLGALATIVVLGTPAAAELRQVEPGHVVSVMPSMAEESHGGIPTLARHPSHAGHHDASKNAFSNLDYGGGPVMPNNTNYALYWQPAGAPAYPADYQSGLNQYFIDIAHDSGNATNADSVTTQYNDALGNAASYSSSFGGALLDDQPYPAQQCLNAPICLTDAQIEDELVRYVDAHHLPRDLTHEYFVFTPPGVETCFGTSSFNCSANAFPNPGFCAYHGNTTSAPPIVYAVDPYVVGRRGCDDGNHPNGLSSDGELIGGVSHEHDESVTDPLPNSAWTDWAFGFNTGYEIGDKCEWGPITGKPLGTAPNGALYNQVINGHPYWLQEEWSNQDHACLQRFSADGSRPLAQFDSEPGAGQTMTFNASKSSAHHGIAYYAWQFNDSWNGTFSQQRTTSAVVLHTFPAAGIYEVALTVVAKDGTSIGTARVIQTGQPGPQPAIAITTSHPRAGSPVSFTAAGSTSPAGSIVYVLWNPGDATGYAKGTALSHTYASPGTYWVTVTVFDDSGQRASLTVRVVVK